MDYHGMKRAYDAWPVLDIVMQVALIAVVVMFLAASVWQRFDVFAPIGYIESLAWAGGVFTVKWTLNR